MAEVTIAARKEFGLPDYGGPDDYSRGGPPLETWEILRNGFAHWLSRRRWLVRTLRFISSVAAWVLIPTFVLCLLFIPDFLTVIGPGIYLLINLATVALLARTRTLSWGAIARIFSLSIPWSFQIALLTEYAGSFIELTPNDSAMSYFMAGFFEEALKLWPLLLMALVAPGRVRRFSLSDWFLVGLASGSAFSAFEDGIRNIGGGVVQNTLRELFANRDIDTYSYNPWFSGGFSFHGVFFPGHGIATSLISVSIGLGVYLWRKNQGVLSRISALIFPTLIYFIVASAHCGFNVSVGIGRGWEDAPLSLPVQIGWWFSLRGNLLIVANLLLFVLCLLLDSIRRVKSAYFGIQNGPWGWPLANIPQRSVFGACGQAFRALWHYSIHDITTVLVSYSPAGGSRWRAVAKARVARYAVMQVRRAAMAVTLPGVEPRSRRRFRVTALFVGLVGTGICLAIGMLLAATTTDPFSLTLPTQGNPEWDGTFLAGLLDNLADWWDSLGFGGQLLVMLLLTGVFAVAVPGWGLALAGMVTWAFEHGHGLGALIRDPNAAVRDYLTNTSPLQMGLDAVDFVLTFVALPSLPRFLRWGDDAARAAPSVRPPRPPWHGAQTAGELALERPARIAARDGANAHLRHTLNDLVAQGLDPQWNRPELFYADELARTLDKMAAAGVDERMIRQIEIAAEARRDAYIAVRDLGENVGELGGEQLLWERGYDVPPIFQTSNEAIVGHHKVDGFAVSADGTEIVVPEFKGFTAKVRPSTTHKLDYLGGRAAQGTEAYTLDRMLCDDRVATYFAHHPEQWHNVSTQRTALYVEEISTPEVGPTTVVQRVPINIANYPQWAQIMQSKINDILRAGNP